MRNGVTTQTQDFNRAQNLNEDEAKATRRKNTAVKDNRGLQETWEWYDACYMRERNKGM
jgi:hypothetical protein